MNGFKSSVALPKLDHQMQRVMHVANSSYASVSFRADGSVQPCLILFQAFAAFGETIGTISVSLLGEVSVTLFKPQLAIRTEIGGEQFWHCAWQILE